MLGSIPRLLLITIHLLFFQRSILRTLLGLDWGHQPTDPLKSPKIEIDEYSIRFKIEMKGDIHTKSFLYDKAS